MRKRKLKERKAVAWRIFTSDSQPVVQIPPLILEVVPDGTCGTPRYLRPAARPRTQHNSDRSLGLEGRRFVF